MRNSARFTNLSFGLTQEISTRKPSYLRHYVSCTNRNFDGEWTWLPCTTHPIMIIHIVINVTVLDEFWNKRLYILFIGSFGICQCVNEMVFFWRFDLDQVSSVLPTNLSSVIPLVCQPVEQQITRWVKSRPSLWADTSCRTENKI